MPQAKLSRLRDDRNKRFTFSAVGDVREVSGQVFRVVRFEDRQRKDGSAVQAAVLEAPCTHCLAPFEMWQPLSGARFWPSRRCEDHRRSGKVGNAQMKRFREALQVLS